METIEDRVMEEENYTDDVISYLDAEIKVQINGIPFSHGKDDEQDEIEDSAWSALYETLDQCGDWELVDTIDFKIRDGE